MDQMMMVHIILFEKKNDGPYIIKLNNMKMTYNKQISIQVTWQGQL